MSSLLTPLGNGAFALSAVTLVLMAFALVLVLLIYLTSQRQHLFAVTRLERNLHALNKWVAHSKQDKDRSRSGFAE